MEVCLYPKSNQIVSSAVLLSSQAAGDKIISINRTDIEGLTSTRETTDSILRSSSGLIVIVAEKI